jgi:tetratricopeptide (TPR) repeat protein
VRANYRNHSKGVNHWFDTIVIDVVFNGLDWAAIDDKYSEARGKDRTEMGEAYDAIRNYMQTTAFKDDPISVFKILGSGMYLHVYRNFQVAVKEYLDKFRNLLTKSHESLNEINNIVSEVSKLKDSEKKTTILNSINVIKNDCQNSVNKMDSFVADMNYYYAWGKYTDAKNLYETSIEYSNKAIKSALDAISKSKEIIDYYTNYGYDNKEDNVNKKVGEGNGSGSGGGSGGGLYDDKKKDDKEPDWFEENWWMIAAAFVLIIIVISIK